MNESERSLEILESSAPMNRTKGYVFPTRYRALESEILRLFPEFKPKPINRRQRRSACRRVELI